MADDQIPGGGRYLSRQELSDLFNDALGNTDTLAVDRRKLYGKQAGRIFADAVNAADQELGFQNSTQYYAPDQYAPGTVTVDANGRVLDSNGNVISTVNGASPGFVEWDVPTSSTNYKRPRTVAAGYTPNPNDPDNGTMTVVFRDGTFYNYYQVSPTEWEAFHASYSKGKPWLNLKNSQQASDGLFIGKPRGIATDKSEIDPHIREQLYRVARTQQQKIRPKAGRSFQKPGYRDGQGVMTPIQNRVGRSPGAYKAGNVIAGRNRPTANKPKNSAARRKAS
jgi:hypothetical protein